MEWHHPLRPRIGTRPALMDSQGRPISALPYIQIGPWPTHFELLVNLPLEPNLFGYYRVQCTAATLPETLARVLANPEGEFAMWGWRYAETRRAPTPAAAKPKAGALPPITLEDLGL